MPKAIHSLRSPSRRTKALAFLGGILLTSLGMASDAVAQVKVMSLGDSLCHGNMTALRSLVRNSSLNVDWVGSKRDGPSSDSDNECHGGWSAAQVIGSAPPPTWEAPDVAILPQWLASANPEIVLLMLGTNDIFRGTSEKIEQNLSQILDTIEAHRSVNHLVVASIPPITYSGGDQEARNVSSAIERVVRQKTLQGAPVSFLDMQTKISADGVSADAVHMNDRGNELMARAWYESLEAAMRMSTPKATPTIVPTTTPPPPTPTKSPAPVPSGAISNDFETASAAPLEAKRGEWKVENGAYRVSSGKNPNALSLLPGSYSTFDMTVRLNSHYGANGNKAGVLFFFRDEADHYRLSLDPTGRIQLMRINKGSHQVILRGRYPRAGQNRWITLNAKAAAGNLIVRVNGQRVLPSFRIPPKASGALGLFADWNVVSFDDLVVKAKDGTSQPLPPTPTPRPTPTITPTPSPTRTAIPAPATVNSINTVINDMVLSHEAVLSGVPVFYSWGRGPRVGMGNEPGAFRAMTAWGQIYREEGSPIPSNTRVEIRSLKSYVLSKRDKRWHSLQGEGRIEGSAFREDFANNENVQPNMRQEPSGNISIRLTEGYNFHFWPSARAEIDPTDIGGILVTFQARLINEDSSRPDDRGQARILGGAGGDYWLNLSAPWDQFKTNGDFSIGRMKFITREWGAFNAHTLSQSAIAETPPPLE